MDGQSRLAGEPVVWVVAAVVAVLAINVAVLWVVLDRDTASPPTEPGILSSDRAGITPRAPVT